MLAPDLTEATGAPVVLTLAPQQCTDDVVPRLKSILGEHRGVVPVHLRLADGRGRTTTLRLDDDLCVRRSQGLFAELKMLLGADAVT